jgi:hypothetical protein
MQGKNYFFSKNFKALKNALFQPKKAIICFSDADYADFAKTNS